MTPAERRAKVYADRESGMTFVEIGRRFNFSASRARQLYWKARRDLWKAMK